MTKLFARSIETTPSVQAGLTISDTAGAKIPGWAALGAVLAIYAVFFGQGILNAYEVAFLGREVGSVDYSTFDGVSDVATRSAAIALSVVLLIGVTRYVRQVPWSLAGVPGRGARAWPTLLTVLLAGMALVFAGAAMAAVTADPGENTNSVATGGPWALLAIVSDLSAGVVEEIVIVAIPVLLLRRAGWAPAAVLALSVAMRWPFHIYHGVWETLPWAIIWGGAYCALYLYLRRLLPLIAIHAMFDLQIDYGQSFGPVARVAVIGAGLAVVVWLGYRSMRQRVDHLDSRSAAAMPWRTRLGQLPRIVRALAAIMLLLVGALAVGACLSAAEGRADDALVYGIQTVLLAGLLIGLFTHSVAWSAADTRAELRLDPNKSSIVTWYTPRPGVITISRFRNMDPVTAFRAVAEHEPTARTVQVYGVKKYADQFAAAGHPFRRYPGSLSHCVSMSREEAVRLSSQQVRAD